MFLETEKGKGNLAYSPFKSCVVPRPIGWISTVNQQGIVNIAPYSYFNAVADIPPVIMYSSSKKANGEEKDSIRNIEETGEFVVNIATFDMREKVKLSSEPIEYGKSEAELYDIKTISSKMVKPPRIKNSPISLECKFIKKLLLEVDSKKVSSTVVFGHVVGIYINDEVIVDGKIDLSKIKPIARLGYNEYTVVDNIFKM